MYKITVATNCYEKDIDFLLAQNGLKRAFESFNYMFYERLLIINTAEKSPETVRLAENCINEGIIDSYYFTCEHRAEILDHFKIKDFKKRIKLNLSAKQGLVNNLKNIYHFYFPVIGKSRLINPITREYDGEGYSVGPLTAIYFAKGDYLLYFTEDCIQSEGDGWIDPAIRLLSENPQFFCARPFNDNLDLNWYKNWKIIENFYIRFVFTDQMFLASTRELNNLDYNYKFENSYPVYGGTGFESRIFNYLQKSKQTILISTNCKFLHEYPEYIKNKK